MPGYINPMVGKVGYYSPVIQIFGSCRAGSYGYGTLYPVPYTGHVNPWLRRDFVRGRGRGRFGYW